MSDIDYNFYESWTIEGGDKIDLCNTAGLRIPYPNSFFSDGCGYQDNPMNGCIGSPDFTSWPGNMIGGTVSTDGPENDHTYNMNGNRMKFELSDYNPNTELNLYTYASFNDPQLVKIEDDVFQVDKNDLIQDPTLAELNADSSLLDIDPLEFDDIILPGEECSAAILRNELVPKVELCNTFDGKLLTVPSIVARSDSMKNSIKKELSSQCGEGRKTKFFNESGMRSLFSNALASKLADDEMSATVTAMPDPVKREQDTDQADAESFSSIVSNHEASLENEPVAASVENNSWNGESNDEGFDSDSDVSDHESFDGMYIY